MTKAARAGTGNGARRVVGAGFHAAVHALLRTVPRGAVTTYGDLARALGSERVARHVGWALAAVPADGDVPWWRVVAAAGVLPRAGSAAARRHAQRLRADGVMVVRGRVVEFALRRFPLAP